MEKTLIQTFIDIYSQIKLDYREKKYPGFIKNIIASNQRKKLYKSINEFTSVPVLEVEELKYYIHLVNDIYGGVYDYTGNYQNQQDKAQKPAVKFIHAKAPSCLRQPKLSSWLA